MIEAFREDEIDVGIGLTEAWVGGISKSDPQRPVPYHIVGSYVESPLLWAISTGGNREDIDSVEDLKGKKVGISRLGRCERPVVAFYVLTHPSGSHIMADVLAQRHGWMKDGAKSLEFIVCGPFAPLRGGRQQWQGRLFHVGTLHVKEIF